MPESEFSEITLHKPAMAFRVEEPTHLTDYAPHTVKIGQRGCLAICRDSKGGFDVLGVNGQSYWLPESAVVWGRKV